MGEWKVQISVRVPQALRTEMEEFAWSGRRFSILSPNRPIITSTASSGG
jgi:hypothetical protein